MPIGDSYTVGYGLPKEQSLPHLLTEGLRKQGLNVRLVANPAISGWTSEQAIQDELPTYLAAKPDFSTLLIGGNDVLQGVPLKTFRKNLTYLMDQMSLVTSTDRILVLTIPDAAITPAGKKYGGGSEVVIKRFNQIIKEEAEARKMKVVDLFPLTKQMENNVFLVHTDNFHPSGLEYQRWVKQISPVALEMLKR